MTGHGRSLRWRIVSRPLREPFRIADRCYDAFDTINVEIGERGCLGRGEGAPLGYLSQTIADLAGWVEAARPMIEQGGDRAMLRERMPASGARNALDCALWDLEAQLTGRPVWDLAGVGAPKPVRTTFTIGCGNPAEMARSALGWSAASALKLKLGGDGQDAARIDAVRKARPDAWIGVDANRSLTPLSFKALGTALRDAAIALVEQPLPIGCEALVPHLGAQLPIIADESLQTLDDLPAIRSSFDGINIKLDKCGGLTEALLLVEAARAAGLQVMVGNMGGSSIAMAPAWMLAGLCDHVDLDGPIYLKDDEQPAASYSAGLVSCDPALWGTPRNEAGEPVR